MYFYPTHTKVPRKFISSTSKILQSENISHKFINTVAIQIPAEFTTAQKEATKKQTLQQFANTAENKK